MNEKIKNLAMNISLNLHEMNEMIVNESASPLEMYIQLKKIENIFKDVLKGAQDGAILEASKYEKTFEMYGAEIQYRNGSKLWDFKNCASWVDKKSELAQIENDLKNTFNLYQSGKQVVTGDGELMEIPNVTYSNDTISIKFKK